MYFVIIDDCSQLHQMIPSRISCVLYSVLAILMLGNAALSEDEIPPLSKKFHAQTPRAEIAIEQETSNNQTENNQDSISSSKKPLRPTSMQKDSSIILETSTLGKSQIGFTKAADGNEIFVVATAASTGESSQLASMITMMSHNSGTARVVVIDLGLSEAEKNDLQKSYNIDFRDPPPAHHQCTLPLKSQLVYHILKYFDVVVWADIGHLPPWDFRRLLDDFPLGTAFVGNFSSCKLPRVLPKRLKALSPGSSLARVISSRFFAIIVDYRFYSRVLLPWVQCSSGLPCPTSMQEYASSLPANFTCQARDDALLTFLLTAFEAQRPRSVLLDVSLPASTSQAPARASLGPPRLPRIGDSDGRLPAGPLLACVPLFGPNNQVVMLLHAAWLAEQYGARVLMPPIRPHYLKTERANVSQDSAQMPAADVFSAHFLYRRAILVDNSSESVVSGLLSKLDVIILEPHMMPNCAYRQTCTVADLLPVKYLGAFLDSIGARRSPHVRVPVNTGKGSPQARANASLAAGRVPLFVWYTIDFFRVHKASIPIFRAGPFRVPHVMLARDFRPARACLAVHIRLHDHHKGSDGAITVQSVPEEGLLGAPADLVLRGSRWPGLSVAGVIDVVWRAAARRGLGLYVLMPFHRGVFEHLVRMGVATVQDYDLAGLSELEVMAVDMALGAACEVFVPDKVR